jgi:hypothetical protein
MLQARLARLQKADVSGVHPENQADAWNEIEFEIEVLEAALAHLEAAPSGEGAKKQLLDELVGATKSLLAELDKGNIKIIWQECYFAGEEGNLDYMRLILDRLKAQPLEAAKQGEALDLHELREAAGETGNGVCPHAYPLCPHCQPPASQGGCEPGCLVCAHNRARQAALAPTVNKEER